MPAGAGGLRAEFRVAQSGGRQRSLQIYLGEQRKGTARPQGLGGRTGRAMRMPREEGIGGVLFNLRLSPVHQSSPCLPALPRPVVPSLVYIAFFQGQDSGTNHPTEGAGSRS